MYISEVIIDGFKSYSSRTVVGQFDPHFNAITGLNGSGKSNILDAICFVLGINNLSQVRVSNLQELVYKQGQAGITKASVTIKFINTDPKCSPIGYEQHNTITVTRQIAIGGKNKFIINGRSSLQKDVDNLFHSVQLNVNNPHFLIMQGRITKVLNMKPPEILSMIEEASGTRMYETKKQSAQKTIEKKHQKVLEITKVMDEEIAPQLEKLRSDRQNFSTWSSNSSELEKLERFLTAFNFRDVEDRVKSAELEKVTIRDQMAATALRITETNSQIEETSQKIVELESARTGTAEDEMTALKKREASASVEVAKFTSSLKNHKDSLAQERDSQSLLIKQEKCGRDTLAEKGSELTRCKKELDKKEADMKAAEAEEEQVRERYENACAGIANKNDAELLSLPEQIATWENIDRQAESKLKQGRLREKHNKDRLKSLSQEVLKQREAGDRTASELTGLRAALTAAESALEALHYSPQQEVEAAARVALLRETVQKCRDKVSELATQAEVRLRFEFRDPSKDFDRSRVKGILAKLFALKDPSTATALEIAAGGKLYSVVVDNEQTSKAILERGALKKRTTFYPLNKLTTYPFSTQKLRAAKEMAANKGGSADLALELVEFEDEVRKAIEFVFGNTVVCSNKETASAITYNPSTSCRSVTLDGDLYNNDGTLSGGAVNHGGMILMKLGELRGVRDTLEAHERELKQAIDVLDAVRTKASRARELNSELVKSRNEFAMCEQRHASSGFAQASANLGAVEKEIRDWEQESAALTTASVEAKERLSQLRAADESSSSKRDAALKALELEKKAATKAVTASKTQVTAAKRQRDVIAAESEAAAADLRAVSEQLAICTSAVQRLTEEGVVLQEQANLAREAHAVAKEAVTRKQDELNLCSKEIKALTQQKTKLVSAGKELEKAMQGLQKRLVELDGVVREASKVVEGMLKTHSWIARDREYFGVSGSSFDFAAANIPESRTRLSKLRDDQERLGRTINRKVMGMIAEAESQYEDLKKKREVVVRDKLKIEAVMEELDVKKAESLQRTWVRVNADFGSIFSTLLPGCSAKLSPPDNGSVMDGLEVKVAFHGVWKESLTELSGGQRSLLALSLILSLLLFKPAPMYILDEVDAALDLSHTENIGLMLRTHFSNSQFVVVSLKEGMFNNANVIFRTRFVDGLSTVMRTCPSTRGVRGDPQSVSSEDREPSKKRGKAMRAVQYDAENVMT